MYIMWTLNGKKLFLDKQKNFGCESEQFVQVTYNQIQVVWSVFLGESPTWDI